MDSIFECEIVGFFVFNNKCWPKCDILFCHNWKDDNWLSDTKNIELKKQLPNSYLHVETRWRFYKCYTCSNDELIRFNLNVSIIMNKVKWMYIDICLYWKPTCIEKIFMLKIFFVHGK